MVKAEKELAKKLIAKHENFSKSSINFTREEHLIIDRWLALKILNEDAFVDMTSGNSDHKEYFCRLGYPFTPLGNEEIKKSWYFQFRDSKGVKIIRDISTVIAFFASLYALFTK